MLISFGCATRSHVANDYESVLRESPKLTRRTVVLFLIDGLSESTLRVSLEGMPHLRSFFKTEQGVYRAHAPFPSLTFPGISSLLKEKPVSQTGFIGNSFRYDGETINFEKPFKRKSIGELMNSETVFSRLNSKGYRSVSLDYGLGIRASAYSPIEDLSTVLSLAQGDYAYADSKRIEAVELLLSQHPPENWPSFIFIHLVGVDFLAHSNGPLDAKTIGYLMGLDDKLQPLLEVLRKQESKHQVISLLTADHGFSEKIKYTLDIKSILAKVSENFEVLNEARMAAVFLKNKSKNDYVAQSLLRHKGVELVGLKTAKGFLIQSNLKKIEVQIRRFENCLEDKIAISIQDSGWICPSSLSAKDPFGYPFFLSNLAHYFSASNSPDLIAVPDSETAFSKEYVGYHGGPTAEETMVPVLMRNSSMSSGQAPPLWRLLPQLID